MSVRGAKSTPAGDTVAACTEAAGLPCRLGRDPVADALSDIEWKTKLVGAGRSFRSGGAIKRDLEALLSALTRVESLIGGQPGRELLGALGTVTPEPLDAVILGREIAERVAVLMRNVAAAIEADDACRAASGPGGPGLFGVEKAFTPEAFRLLALGELYAKMFGKRPAATDNGPFYRFVAAAFEHWGRRRPTQAMVRRHLERYPPRPPADSPLEGDTGK